MIRLFGINAREASDVRADGNFEELTDVTTAIVADGGRSSIRKVITGGFALSRRRVRSSVFAKPIHEGRKHKLMRTL